jgi:hypothetical protein
MVVIHTNRLSKRHSLERTAEEGHCKKFPVSKFNGLYWCVITVEYYYLIIPGQCVRTIEVYCECNLPNNFSVKKSGRMRGDGM